MHSCSVTRTPRHQCAVCSGECNTQTRIPRDTRHSLTRDSTWLLGGGRGHARHTHTRIHIIDCVITFRRRRSKDYGGTEERAIADSAFARRGGCCMDAGCRRCRYCYLLWALGGGGVGIDLSLVSAIASRPHAARDWHWVSCAVPVKSRAGLRLRSRNLIKSNAVSIWSGDYVKRFCTA